MDPIISLNILALDHRQYFEWQYDVEHGTCIAKYIIYENIKACSRLTEVAHRVQTWIYLSKYQRHTLLEKYSVSVQLWMYWSIEINSHSHIKLWRFGALSARTLTSIFATERLSLLEKAMPQKIWPACCNGTQNLLSTIFVPIQKVSMSSGTVKCLCFSLILVQELWLPLTCLVACLVVALRLM